MDYVGLMLAETIGRRLQTETRIENLEIEDTSPRRLVSTNFGLELLNNSPKLNYNSLSFLFDK